MYQSVKVRSIVLTMCVLFAQRDLICRLEMYVRLFLFKVDQVFKHNIKSGEETGITHCKCSNYKWNLSFD